MKVLFSFKNTVCDIYAVKEGEVENEKLKDNERNVISYRAHRTNG